MYALPSPTDPDRAALIAICELRGPPLKLHQLPCRRIVGDRKHPTNCAICLRFSRAAGEYLQRHERFVLRYVAKLGARHIPAEDLHQACRLGAYTALCRFDLQKAGKFLSLARYWMWCETGKLIHGGESLVPIPQPVKQRHRQMESLIEAGQHLSDEDLADAMGETVADIRALKALHLGHDHREWTENAAGVRGVLDELRQEHDRRGEELRLHSAIPAALAALSAVEQTALYDAYGVGERIEGVRRPLTEEGRRAVLRMAKRNLLHALRDAPDLADHPWLTIPRLNTPASTSPGPTQIARQLAQEPSNVPAMGAKPGAALNGFLGAPAQGSGHAETSASTTAPATAGSASPPAAPVLVALEGGAAQAAAPVEGGAGAVAGVAEAMSSSRRALRRRWASCATGWLRARGGRSAGAGQ
mgnify:CR=1 FL=1